MTTSQGTTERIAPLLNWPGGKRALVEELLQVLPTNFNRYFEPFFGGGALYFALRPDSGFISDSNSWLIESYIEIRDRPEAVWSTLCELRNSSDDYYRVRNWRPRSAHARAAKLIYLVNLSFNGIYRENLRGEFNVPYGGKTWKQPATWEHLSEVSTALANAQISVSDFAEAANLAKPRDLVYFDPPYVTATSSGFSKYNASLFTWDDQLRLSRYARKLADRGVFVAVSNIHNPEISRLYPGFEEHVIQRHSRIAASSKHRRRVSEIVLVGGR